MCRGFDPLFSLWQDRARSFWGTFSHPPTPKRSFWYQFLDLFGPKFHYSLDLFGSNFQRPAAHPRRFLDRVPPPPPRGYGTGAHFCSEWSTVLWDMEQVHSGICEIGLLFLHIFKWAQS